MTTQQITLRKAPTCALTAPPCTDMTPPPPMAPTMLGTLHVRETVKKKLHEQHRAGETFTPAEAQSLPLNAPCGLWLRPRAPYMPQPRPQAPYMPPVASG